MGVVYEKYRKIIMIELNIEPKDLSIIIDALEHYHWNMGTESDDRDYIDGLTQSLEKLEKI